MLSRLDSEERMELVTVTQAGSGRMAKARFEGYMRELGARMRGDGQVQPHAVRPKSFDELAAFGIQIVHEGDSKGPSRPRRTTA